MQITIKEVTTANDLKLFIQLPFKIHKNHDEWVPSLINDDIATFYPNKNEAYKYCATIKFLAYKGGELKGRIMGIIHHQYNELNNEQNGRFAFMEVYDDKEVFDALINSVEKWAYEKGCNKLIGPLGFSDKDPQGFLIEGYKKQTMMLTNCSYPFMTKYITDAGYKPHTKLVEYRIPLTDQLISRLSVFAKRPKNNPDIKLLEFKKTSEIKPYIREVFELINLTYSEIYGFTPLSVKEADNFSKRYLPFINPRLVKIVLNGKGSIIGFIVAMSDFSKGIKQANGKLLPFGWFHILRNMRNSDTLVLFLGSVKEEYRHRGIDALMAESLFKDSKVYGFKYVDSHLIMERNVKMRSEIERLEGSELYKRYCIFEKPL